MPYHVNPIGFIHSPYNEKFGTPRQANLSPHGKGQLRLISPYNDLSIVKGIEQFSHLWLVFLFHQTAEQGWHSMVRPPRLGGNKKLGLFATRSNFRPNPIGLSAVELHSVSYQNSELILHLGSLDLIDGTPILDIKPYIPYSDAIPKARAGYAQEAPLQCLTVTLTESVEHSLYDQPELKALIIETLSLDPRPAYKKKGKQPQDYGITLANREIKFTIEHDHVTVYEVN